MLKRFPGFVLLFCCAAMPAQAELQGAGLQGGSSLKSGGLQGSDLKTSRLDGGSLKTSKLRGGKLQSAKPEAGEKLLNPATLKRKATELTEGGLGVVQIRGATSSIPRTQIGQLFYDVADLLLSQGGELTDVGVGYLMAVLADPEGERHDDALARLKEIFLDKELKHEDAVRMYDNGLETMKGLVELGVGLTPLGQQAGLRTLQEVKLAYHQRRQLDMAEPEEGSGEAEEQEGSEAPVESR